MKPSLLLHYQSRGMSSYYFQVSSLAHKRQLKKSRQVLRDIKNINMHALEVT